MSSTCENRGDFLLSVNSSSGGVELKFVSDKVAFFKDNPMQKCGILKVFIVILLEGGNPKAADLAILQTLSGPLYCAVI